MSRQPVTLVPAGALTDREKLWSAMRRLTVFTVSDLTHSVNTGRSRDEAISASLATDYLRGLVRAGILTAESAAFTRTTYTLARDMGVRAPRVRKDGTILPDSGRTRMWKAMRVLGDFSPRELMHAAGLPGAPIAHNEAKTYCQWLARAGYLTQSGGRYRFITARFTGAKAPQILRVKQLLDPNLGAVVYESVPEGRDDL